MAISATAVAIFLCGGGIYDIFRRPPVAYPLQSGAFAFFAPSSWQWWSEWAGINGQLLMGSFAIMIIYGLGATGLLLIYRSTRYIRNPRQVSFLTKIGVALILVAFTFVEIVIYLILHS
jgi:hypothetical protein